MFGKWFARAVPQEESSVVTFRMSVPAAVRQEGKMFYSSCPLLDVHSQGASEKEALDNLVEALQLFVETCYEQGTLGEVLRAQGLMPAHGSPVAPEGRWVEVPWALIAHAAAHAH